MPALYVLHSLSISGASIGRKRTELLLGTLAALGLTDALELRRAKNQESRENHDI
jgi:hypothetical protein